MLETVFLVNWFYIDLQLNDWLGHSDTTIHLFGGILGRMESVERFLVFDGALQPLLCNVKVFVL